MPVVEHAVRLPEKAGAKDDVGPAVEQGRQELGILPRVVFEIGILHDHDVSGGSCEACSQGGALAGIPVVQAEPDVRPRGDMLREPLPRAIRRAVVHDDDFHRQPVGQRGGHDAIECLRDQRPFVVDRDDNAQFHGVGLHRLRRGTRRHTKDADARMTRKISYSTLDRREATRRTYPFVPVGQPAGATAGSAHQGDGSGSRR